MIFIIRTVAALFALVATAAVSAPIQSVPAAVSRDAAPKAGPRVTSEKKFSSWGLSCAVALDGRGSPAEHCMISQMVATEPKRGKVVLGVMVDYMDSATVPSMRFRFSPGAIIERGIGIKIDKHPELRLAIQDCNAQRCESVGRLSPAVLKMWRSGKSAQLAFIGQTGKQVLLPISLSGFDAALSALSRQRTRSN
jgi:invasion protein IalB